MRKRAENYKAGCQEALDFLRSIAGRMHGSAYNRMLNFRQLTNAGGEIDRLCEKLVCILSDGEPEANVTITHPKGAILALGHLDVAKNLLHETVRASDNVHAAMDLSSDKAIEHLERAIEAVER